MMNGKNTEKIQQNAVVQLQSKWDDNDGYVMISLFCFLKKVSRLMLSVFFSIQFFCYNLYL